MALGVQLEQIVDMPSWAKSESFDITAKAPESTRGSMDTYRPMLVDPLADGGRLEPRT